MELEFTGIREITDTEKSKGEIEKDLLAADEQKKAAAIMAIAAEAVAAASESVEIKDEELLGLISKKLNKTVSSFDELMNQKEAEVLPEDVATFLKYKKETGRGIEDFIKIQRDVDSMTEEDLLFEYLSTKEEGLDKDDINSLISEFVADEDMDTEAEIKKKNIARKKTLNEAKKFFKIQKETYKVPLVSSLVSVPDGEKDEFESYKQYIANSKSVEEQNKKKGEWFDQKSQEVFSNEFKGFGFKFKIGENDAEKSFVFAPGDAAELKTAQSTPLNFINKFMDENGLMKDAVGYHRGLAMAMNPDKFAKFFYEQGIADKTESDDKRMKNINMGIRQAPQVMAKDGFKAREVNSDSYSGGLKILNVRKINS